MSTGRSHQSTSSAASSPKPVTRDSLETGEVGFVIAGIKEIDGAPVGDTITLEQSRPQQPLAGFQAGAAAGFRGSVSR